jgi:hypothetical protein
VLAQAVRVSSVAEAASTLIVVLVLDMSVVSFDEAFSVLIDGIGGCRRAACKKGGNRAREAVWPAL